MTCQEYRRDLMEWARGAGAAPAVRLHVAGCAECARLLEEQQALSEALGLMAAEKIPSPGELAGPVMAAFDRRRRSARMRIMGWVAAGAVAAAASLAVMVTPPRLAPQPESAPFIPIPYTVPLAPEERATVVRMEIPVTALIAAGFEMPATDPAATVQADVLVSQDGRARAISIVSSN